MEKEQTQNKMGQEPVYKLMFTMGIPMVISMMLQAFYNIVDSYFISNMSDTAELTGVGEYGINALTLAFPIQMLMIAIGVGTGVGINALLSRSLGEGNREKASQIAGNAIFLGICTFLVFLLVGLFGVDAYLKTQTSDPVVLGMGSAYLKICTVWSLGAILSMIYEKLLQATGRTTLSTIAQIAGALTNIILDPILIFGYLGFPAQGVAGAAIATVTGQFVTLILGMIFHHSLNKEVNGSFQYLKPEKTIIVQIYQVGIPAIFMQALMSFMTYGMNIIFGRLSGTVVTAYGIYYKIQQFVFFAAFGLNNAIIPIISFNYGRGDKERLKDGIKFGLIYTIGVMTLGAVGLQLFASPLMNLFSLSIETELLCVSAIRIITLGYLFVGANIAFQGIFQAFGNGMKSLIVSTIRLLVVTLPLAYLFTLFTNAEQIIWWAFPAAEACALAVALLFMYQIAKTKLKPLKNPKEQHVCCCNT